MKLFFTAAALLVLTACSGGNPKDLVGKSWKLTSMAGIPAEVIVAEDAFVMEFNGEEKSFAGRTNCNRFFGHYELKGRELDFDNMGMTRMACPDMIYEDIFVKMLDDVDRYKLKGSELTLLDDKRVLAVFKVDAPAQAK